MLGKLLELITGKDDVERIAQTENLDSLNDYLKTRRLLFPKKPARFLDAATFTQEQLLELMEEESQALSGDAVELWILEIDGRRRLPAFSSQKKMQAFSSKMSMSLKRVFTLGCVEALISEVTKGADIDFVDLNPYGGKGWEIGVSNEKSDRTNGSNNALFR